MDSIKFIAGQACSIYQYKNLRTKILKWYADISFNRQCLTKKVVPNYASKESCDLTVINKAYINQFLFRSNTYVQVDLQVVSTL
jgi:hypothetical protein